MSFVDLHNPNIFVAENNRAIIQMNTTIGIKCPHCYQLGQFEAVFKNALSYTKQISASNGLANFHAVIRICPNRECNGLVLSIERNGEVIEIKPPQSLDFDLKDLPLICQETLKEAIACHTAGAYRAAAMMVRRLLEEICDLNNAQGSNLHIKLEALRNNIILPQALFDAMGELKALGNDAAHIEAKAYDNIGREEAELSIELAQEILKALYQLQGLLMRLQSRKL